MLITKDLKGKVKPMKRLKLSLIIGLSLSLSILSCSTFDNTASKSINNKTVDNKNSSYVIDVGHGKKGADISVKIDLLSPNSKFKTRASSDGVANKTASDIKSLKFYIIKKTGTGISTMDPYIDTDPTNVTNIIRNDIILNTPSATATINVTFKDTPFSTSSFGSGGYFYLGVRAYDTANATGTELIKSNNDSSVTWTGTTGGANNKFAISNGNNTVPKPGISNIQIKDIDYSISDTTPIGITMYLDDSVGASIDTNVADPTPGASANTTPIANNISGFIETIAGTGVPSNTGDGASATLATLTSPNNLKVDSMGNIYFADTGNNVIKKIDPTGKITIIAGTGIPCSSPTTACGDGGQATSAQLTTPRSVYIEPTNENIIYIADTGNNKIRQIDLTNGFISTIAGTGNSLPYADGGNATDANLSSPSDIVRDSTANNIYISDTNNSRIVRIQSGSISTITGNGTLCTTGLCGDNLFTETASSATLNNPMGLAVDDDDNIYIADSGSNSIRILHTNGNFVVTLNSFNRNAGFSINGTISSSSDLNNPTSVSYDKKTGLLYVSDTGNKVIRTLKNSGDGTINTFAGNNVNCPSPTNNCGDRGVATSANLNNPLGVFVDNSGLVYISDTNDHKIRKVY